jgi:hypothetical protein
MRIKYETLWFREQADAGRLRYLDTEKSQGWSELAGLQLPEVDQQRGAAPLGERKVFTQEDIGKTYNQPVYHGSPHIFDKFTTDHIGSGEGAQAYGWGLYFAGNKEVAKYYRAALTGGPSAPMWSIDGKKIGGWFRAQEAIRAAISPEMQAENIPAGRWTNWLALTIHRMEGGETLEDIR